MDSGKGRGKVFESHFLNNPPFLAGPLGSAFRPQSVCNDLEDRVQLQFVVTQLLQLAVLADYSDEAGRRYGSKDKRGREPKKKMLLLRIEHERCHLHILCIYLHLRIYFLFHVHKHMHTKVDALCYSRCYVHPAAAYRFP